MPFDLERGHRHDSKKFVVPPTLLARHCAAGIYYLPSCMCETCPLDMRTGKAWTLLVFLEKHKYCSWLINLISVEFELRTVTFGIFRVVSTLRPWTFMFSGWLVSPSPVLRSRWTACNNINFLMLVALCILRRDCCQDSVTYCEISQCTLFPKLWMRNTCRCEPSWHLHGSNFEAGGS